ncbi:MAG TPA: VWA domain-containing protein [Pyrinomonadaceae bacterium]|nr:VWA domain-containing protein [Pyrinomonadaceae bacterium]
MQKFNGRSPRNVILLAVCQIALSVGTQAQKTSQTKPSQSEDDIVRVKTELVQTDVSVVDKRGRSIEGLSPEQFQLRVDGKPQTLLFFDQVATGAATEEKQLSAARQAKPSISTTPVAGSSAEPGRGRTIFFFVDDVHLAGDSLTRTRSLLTRFVENKMGAGDRVAIISTSGGIGFLQQLTDNKGVLREAISRIRAKSDPESTASHVYISEVDANMVANHSDRGLFTYLVAETMREYQMKSPMGAVTMVKNRVSQINAQAKTAELETLSRLESFVRSTAPLAGRKVVFFISDGFVVDTKRSNGLEVMQRVSSEAARVGAVIYSLGTRANVFGPGADVSRSDFPDTGGGTAWRSLIEDKAPQEPLETLADETGGRSYLNSNALDDGLSQALAESSSYYLLAWRPDSENQRAGKSRVEISIKDRPDLRVRMRRHFFDLKPAETGRPTISSAGTPEDELRSALGSLYPRRDLPTSVSATLAKTNKGAELNILMQLDSEMLDFEAGEKQNAVVDVLGMALDDRGLFSSFKQRLEIPRAAVGGTNRYVKWTQTLALPAGIYQVRVAVRDRQTARTGSAMLWIEIPGGP